MTKIITLLILSFTALGALCGYIFWYSFFFQSCKCSPHPGGVPCLCGFPPEESVTLEFAIIGFILGVIIAIVYFFIKRKSKK